MKHLPTYITSPIKLKQGFFTLVFFGASILTSKAIADGFSILGDQRSLENKIIITTGNISKKISLTNYSSDSLKIGPPKQTVFEIGRFCFSSSDVFEDISGKAGLLLIDQFSNASIGVITNSMLSINIKMIRIEVLDCASTSLQEIKQLQGHLQQQLEVLKQQQVILEQLRKNQPANIKKAP